MGDHSLQRNGGASTRTITIVQVVLIAFALVCIAWFASKLIGYYQGQQFYKGLQSAYAQGSEVDFDSLCADCPGAVAWIRSDDLETIDYPVMQASDNDFYLHNDAGGNASADGSIFLDYRNSPNPNSDLYSIIYGHNMRDGSMFGTLKSYQDEGFYQQGTGKFTLYTPSGTFRYQIFAVDVVNPHDDAFMVGFKEKTTFDSFVKELKASSIYDTGVQADGNSQVITLSTCSDSSRLIVSAKRVDE